MLNLPTNVNIAHRGASAYAPEHTEAAIRRALDMGAHYIELDIRQTRDGHLVNLHDDTLKRTTNVAQRFPERANASIEHFTLAEVKSLDAGAWFGDGSFAGERVLTLDEVAEIVGDRAGLLVETKPAPAYPDLEERIARSVTARYGENPATERVAAQSFSRESVEKMARFAPGIARVQLVYVILAPFVNLAEIRTYASGVGPSLILLGEGMIRAAHEQGLTVYPYTFQGRDRDLVRAGIRHALEIGVDGCITDNPDIMTEVLQER